MGRYVIDAGVAIKLVEENIDIAPGCEVLAPTLMRSQVLDLLHQRVRRSELSEETALSTNTRFAKRRFRYLGDAVLRRRAWSVADALGMASTFGAEYIALTELQADALITDDPQFAALARKRVQIEALRAIT